MRIGILCPYSLTLPGGVQMQVLGLARALRKQGERVRVLAPCDGPPPDAGVTPLGNSLPTAANGSIAPIAPDPSAQLRVIRAMRDEEFDVIHLHEPLSPGPNQTALLLRPAPLIGTFHAAGGSLAYELMRRPSRFLASRLDDRCAVSDDARKMAQEALGGTYDLTFNGVELARFASGTPHPTTGPTIFFLGRHEPRKGLRVLLDAMADLPPETRLWVAGEGGETAELRAQHAGDARIEWLGTISETEKIAHCAVRTSFVLRRSGANRSASSCLREWPPGRRLLRVTYPATPTLPVKVAMRCSSRPATPVPSGRHSPKCSPMLRNVSALSNRDSSERRSSRWLASLSSIWSGTSD